MGRGEIRQAIGCSGVGFLPHLIGNKGEVRIFFLGKGNLLVPGCGLFRRGKTRDLRRRGSGGHVGPWFPVGVGDADLEVVGNMFPLRDNNR